MAFLFYAGAIVLFTLKLLGLVTVSWWIVALVALVPAILLLIFIIGLGLAISL